MAEYEGMEIPEELLDGIAGGTVSHGMQKRFTQMARYLRKKGSGKDECVQTIVDAIAKWPEAEDLSSDIASIVESVYAEF